MQVQPSPIAPIALENDAILQLIARLQDEPGADLSAKNLAALTDRDPSNMPRTLKRMQEAGLIFRDPTPELTSDGRAALEALNRARNAELGDGVTLAAVATTGWHSEFTPNPDNPRKKFDAAALELFADTIEAKGILMPLAVSPPNAQGLRVIWAGERRWRAAGIVNARHHDANRVRIPFVERERIEVEQEEQAAAEAAEVALIENGQRENLSTYEEAVAFRALIPSKYPSASQAAKAVGVDPKTVQDRLKALETLKGDQLEAWKNGVLTWREVRDIFRPPVERAVDPAQTDIEEFAPTPAAPARPPMHEALGQLADKLKAEESEALLRVALARAVHFTDQVKEAALAEARAAKPDRGIVNAKIAGTTTIDGEVWPAAPTETLKAPWDDYPRATINLMVSSEGRWFVATSTSSGAPDYAGYGSPPHVYCNDPLFASRADALAFAAAQIVRRLGVTWGNKRKLKEWLAEVVGEAKSAPIAPASPVDVAKAHMDQLVSGFSRKLELALLEVEHKACADPKTIWLKSGPKGSEGWAIIKDKPAGGAIATLVERELVEVETIGGQWFARVPPSSDAAGWLIEHSYRGEDCKLNRAGRLMVLRTEILGENAAGQIAATRLRFATDCLNTVRPEDVETAQILKEAQAETSATLAELDREKARDAVTVIEVAYHLDRQNDGTAEDRYVKVGAYWLDAIASRLVAAKLIAFSNLGGEIGWVVRAGEAMDAWLRLRNHVSDVVACTSVPSAAIDGYLLAAGLDPSIYEFKFVTPWLGEDTRAMPPATDAAVSEFEPEEFGADDEVEKASAREILSQVVDDIAEPTAIGALLSAAGLQLPLRASTTDFGVVYDATGATVLTVDQDRALPDALAAARAMLIAAAINAFDVGKEVTDEPPAKTVEPDKMTPALMRKSIRPWALTCLEDGRHFTDLKHHLRTEHDLEWGEYLARWKLPADYPSVAPATVEVREVGAVNNARAIWRSVTQ